MSIHHSLREHLLARAEQGNPAEFQPSSDPTLVEFARLFAATQLYSFDANKHQPDDEFAPHYELTTVQLDTPGSVPDEFYRVWSPVNPGQDPLVGFHHGTDSTLWGHRATDVMPQDERTSAMLLLVTIGFVHLSASREQDPPLVRGAINLSGERFAYVVLAS